MATGTLQLSQQSIPIEYCHGKVQELTDVIIRHSRSFHRIAFHHLRNLADAEDAVQDAMLSALKNLHQFREDAKMSTWLTAIVINSSRMKLRRRSPSGQLVLEDGEGEQIPLEDVVSDIRPNPEETYRQRQLSERLARATSRLPPVLRKTLQLRNVDGLSIREIADLLGVPVGTVKARLSRARVRLGHAMKRGLS